MRIDVPCTALGLALASAAPSAAQAQRMIDPQPAVTAPPATSVVTEPARTVRTVTTVRTVRPLPRRRVVVTRRTYVSDSVIPATTTTTVTAAPALAATYPAPLYDYVAPDDYVTPAPAPVAPAPYYRAPLYDTVVQTPAVPVPVGTSVPLYRYVYQPDRILVIDPNTGIAVQAIPR